MAYHTVTCKLFILDNLNISHHKTAPKKKVQLISDQTLSNFQSVLHEETCDAVYSTNNVNNKIFNNFHCILSTDFENSLLIFS
jgi:hypothetical protein